MDKQTLNEHVKQELEQHSLNAGQLQTLRKLQTQQKSKNRSFALWQKSAAVIAASVFIVFIAISQWPQTSLLESIADEVALNHIKLKPLEVKVSSFSGLQTYFTELDFVPVQSSVFSLAPDTLSGGRYCSIQGSIAAQLRYQDESGGIVTLYEAVNDSGQFSSLPDIDKGEVPVELFSRGLKVIIWREKGLVMASVNE